MDLQAFFPPIAVTFARNFVGTKRKKYETYEDALSNCTKHSFNNIEYINGDCRIKIHFIAI
ncbi:MAG: hypothetical protein HQK75_20845 [Candidatus Magnetomorum sp.]|nr:hypothetical protein [Candidatus Magnetomorum sp.]